MSFLRLSLLAVLVACCCSGCHGEMLSLTVPGSNIFLSCPQGQEINIISMRSSQMGSVDNVGRYCSSVQGNNCLRPKFMRWAKNVCDNLQECRLPKIDKRMLLCNTNKRNVLSTLYRCENKFPKKRTVVACHGKEVELKCEKGVIGVVKSNYGRLDKHTCTDKPSYHTFCTAAGFNLGTQCDGKKVCKFPVISKTMPKPTHCDNKPKYLYASYVCE